ncbi:DNA gyrase inhibitor YacG [Tritonibacter horizontis]|uniref:DNA gyrase inhibitor YacG n=1 Tax=Tritonibacter horizontis TaxID=1768241 RepID=A0A132C2I4_9RHOB|nr:DNA gyrase inhibitor YacG [Tritonibacter horizontis]KUP94250.1 DNA gyrase inhibitor YacG [Tritonibacter horizontis]
MSCPICRKPTEHSFRPFCSKRCADLDLSQWLSGGYALPSADQEDLENALEEAEKRGPTEH